LENHVDLANTVVIGLQPRVYLSDRIVDEIKKAPADKIQYSGKSHFIATTFVKNYILQTAQISFSIEGKNVILIDDVLYTGRTIRAALDALLDFSSGKSELNVLIDRRFSRQLPIQPDYIGDPSIISRKK
jgi:pyrimidine operon attenuation protein/uracil phosphoribosyltransferase